MKILKPVISFFIFTCLVALIPAILAYAGAENLLIPGFWGMFFFISGLTLIVLLIVLIVQARNAEMYAAAFLGATTVKLLSCLIFLFIFIKKSHPPKGIFVADFMYLYILNTVFEIYGLLRNLRNQNSK